MVSWAHNMFKPGFGPIKGKSSLTNVILCKQQLRYLSVEAEALVAIGQTNLVNNQVKNYTTYIKSELPWSRAASLASVTLCAVNFPLVTKLCI